MSLPTPNTITVHYAVTMTVPSFLDQFTSWLGQYLQNTTAITLASDVTAEASEIIVNRINWGGGTWASPGATQATVSSLTTGPATPVPSMLAPDQTIVIGGEPMIVQWRSDPDVTTGNITARVSRGSSQLSQAYGTVDLPTVTAAAHSAGDTVSLLRYPTPGEMVRVEAFAPWQVAKTQALGTKSAYYQSSIVLTIAS